MTGGTKAETKVYDECVKVDKREVKISLQKRSRDMSLMPSSYHRDSKASDGSQPEDGVVKCRWIVCVWTEHVVDEKRMR